MMTTRIRTNLYVADLEDTAAEEAAAGWAVRLVHVYDEDRVVLVLEREVAEVRAEVDGDQRYRIAIDQHPRGRTVLAITDAAVDEPIVRITGLLDRVDMDRLVAFVDHANANATITLEET